MWRSWEHDVVVIVVWYVEIWLAVVVAICVIVVGLMPSEVGWVDVSSGIREQRLDTQSTKIRLLLDLQARWVWKVWRSRVVTRAWSCWCIHHVTDAMGSVV